MARRIPGLAAWLALAGCLAVAAAAAAQQPLPPMGRGPVRSVPGPAAAPAGAPTSSPASMPASSPATEKGPWSQAQVGTTVQYKLAGDILQTREVVKVEANTVTIKTTVAVPGTKPSEAPMPRMYTPEELKLTMTVFGRKTGEEKLQVARKECACEVYERVMVLGDRKVLTRTWVCKEIPGWSVRVDNDASGEMKTISLIVEYK